MRHQKTRYFTALSGILLLVITGCGTTTNIQVNNTNNFVVDTPNTVVIPQAQDIFVPFILPVQMHATVTWHNDDVVPHTIVTTPENDVYLNVQTITLTVQPHQTVSLKLDHAGLYHYYDSQFATWDSSYQRVAPNKGVPKFPMEMDGVIWVQGNIPNLPASAANAVVHLKDQILHNFVAIKTGGSVSWHNYDTDAHFFQTVLGYDAPINPVDVGINNLLGSDASPPDGETRSITFDQPGLYYYYCFTHAEVDPITLRVIAKDMASEYPIQMEGFVLVSNEK